MRIHRLYRPVLLVLILALSVVLLTACDPVAGHYPCQLGHGWVCDEPNIVLDNWETEDGTWHYGGDRIILDDNEVELLVGYRGYYAFFSSPKCLYAEDDPIHGTWKIQDGYLIIEITQDNIFDGKYTELVFHPLDTE